MTENATTAGNGQPARRPDWIAYSVRPRQGQKSRWTEIGVAFRHKDGNGLDILADVVPLNGKIVLRVPESTNG
jgi:hypothetical protein